MDIDHRIGFDERDEAVRRLNDHMVAGRLELDEMEERVDLALKARTIGDLIDLFHDLPDEDWMITGHSDALPAVASEKTVSRAVKVGSSPNGYIALGLWSAVAFAAMMGANTALAIALVAAIIVPVVLAATNKRRTETITYVEGDITSEVKALLQADLKIAAIKRWREAHPWVGLAEAKAQVEMIEQGETPPTPELGR